MSRDFPYGSLVYHTKNQQGKKKCVDNTKYIVIKYTCQQDQMVNAVVVESADTRDLKSLVGNDVRVQVPPAAHFHGGVFGFDGNRQNVVSEPWTLTTIKQGQTRTDTNRVALVA